MPDLVLGAVIERRRSNGQQSAVEAEHETASGSRLVVAEEADADTRVRRPVRKKRRGSESLALDNKVECRGLVQGGSSSEKEFVRVLRLYRRCCLCSHAGIASFCPPREQGGRGKRVSRERMSSHLYSGSTVVGPCLLRIVCGSSSVEPSAGIKASADFVEWEWLSSKLGAAWSFVSGKMPAARTGL